ncbi:chemotaxis protein CheW [Endothiovibrio diazotrophicus]
MTDKVKRPNPGDEAAEEGFEVNADTNQYLTFILAGEEYGVDILRVQEVKGWESVTAMPNTAAYIKGVINLRGTIVPILDLRERFALESIPYGPRTVVIVLKVGEGNASKVMGIVVDAVSDVYNVATREMRPPPDFCSVISTDFVRGLATVGEKMVILLDSDKLLNVEEFDEVDLSRRPSRRSHRDGARGTEAPTLQ